MTEDMEYDDSIFRSNMNSWDRQPLLRRGFSLPAISTKEINKMNKNLRIKHRETLSVTKMIES